MQHLAKKIILHLTQVEGFSPKKNRKPTSEPLRTLERVTTPYKLNAIGFDRHNNEPTLDNLNVVYKTKKRLLQIRLSHI